MKTGIMFVVAVAAACIAGARETTVHNVTELVDALTTYQGGSDVIFVDPGEYNLTDIKMSEDKGGSHLFLKGASLKGTTANCDDVKLIGDGTLRVLDTDNTVGWLSTIENITVTNGWAKSVDGVASSGVGGGIRGGHSYKNCKIVGNMADKNGGGIAGGSADHCWIIGNEAGGQGGGAFEASLVANSVVSGNKSTGDGGGIHGGGSGSGTVSGSIVAENTSSGGTGGGICYVAKVTNTSVSLNVATRGGGIASWDINKTVTTDCNVCSNKSTTYGGGGLYMCRMTGGSIFANAAFGSTYACGGGASNARLNAVDVHDNYSANSGGGVYNGAAVNCTLKNNLSGGTSTTTGLYADNSYNAGLEYCDIVGSTVNGGYGLGCKVRDVLKEVVLSGNPHVEYTKTDTRVWVGGAVTNCLFVDNGVQIGAQRVLFSSVRRVVNCSVVSNLVSRTFEGATDTANPVLVENTVFFGNKFCHYGNACDIAEENWLSAGTITAVGAVLFRNCAYGNATYVPYKVSGDATNALRPEFVADGSVAYKFGVDGVKKDPGFVGASVDPENPFALSRKSTLRKKGAYADWMATATDIRGAGYARTRDGKVDIGCYECLIPDPGFLLLFR